LRPFLAAAWGAVRRFPLWVWPLLVLALYAGYLHRQLVHAQRAAFGAKDAAAAAAEAKVTERLKAYDAQSRAIEVRLSDLGRQSTVAADRTRRIEEGLAGAKVAGQKLEESGTVDDVVKFGRSRGYHPFPVRRP
jgi:hypothetical protein